MKIAIVGGGIMGQILAFYLLKHGWQLSLFDYKSTTNCSETAAGLLSPVMELVTNAPIIFHLGMEALKQHWPDILRQLNKQVHFQQQGSLLISHAYDQSELKRKIQTIANKIHNDCYYKAISPLELARLEPQLSHFPCAYFFPHEGQVNSQQILIALKNYLISQGIDWYDGLYVSQVLPGKVIIDRQAYEFDFIFDCRGLGAKKQFSDLRSVRGELIWLHAPNVHLARPIYFSHPRYPLYLVPREEKIYIVGTSEIETEDNSPISVQTTLELLTAIYSLNSSFSEAHILKTSHHCRPTFSNHCPKIIYSAKLIAINGLYRHGFLVAPTLAKEIERWLTQGPLSLHYSALWEERADDFNYLE